MPLEVPNLDDRTYEQLLADARARIPLLNPEWTDLSPHDPGMTLLELFAYLTETMLYRLNRLPEKAYVEFLNLIGLRLRPPSAASVELDVARVGDTDASSGVTLPAGTAVEGVAVAGGRPPTFVLTQPLTLAPGEARTTCTAYHCDLVVAEHVGDGTGLGGQWVRTRRAPMTSTGERDEVVVLVEVRDRTVPREQTVLVDGRSFERWREVDAFTGTEDEGACIVDRAAGTVTFAPADDGGLSSARVPPAGAQIRITYRTGGGRAGNVGAGTLTRWKGSDPGLSVTNPAPAQGGRDIERLDEAMVRGPRDLHTLQRAVTARDFELTAVQAAGEVARARAVTRSAVWCFGAPGEVEVALVPFVHASQGEHVDHRALVDHQTDVALERTREALDARRPLGTRCTVGWARIKPVSVHVSLAVRAEDDAEGIRQRVLRRLYDTITPLPTPASPGGWPFGHALRASNIFRTVEEAEPGVVYVRDLRFELDDAPNGEIRSLAEDAYQPSTWFASSGDALFRSTNDGDGWELARRFDGEEVWDVATHPRPRRPGSVERPGLVAAITHHAGDGGTAVHLSQDLGETWRVVGDFTERARSVCFLDRGEQAASLLVATDIGLYELPLLAGATPLPVTVDAVDQDRPLEVVLAFTGGRGESCVAVAAQAQQGVYLSTEGGRAGTFAPIGLVGRDVRTLAVQLDGTDTTLWAGLGEGAGASERGAVAARLFEADVQWEERGAGWTGGTCWDLGFTADGLVLAATQSGGVLRLDGRTPSATWQPPSDVNCGLPLRDLPRFAPVTAVGTSGDVVVAGTSDGVYRSTDAATTFADIAHQGGADAITIPHTWLLCSGEHVVEIVERDAARVD